MAKTTHQSHCNDNHKLFTIRRDTSVFSSEIHSRTQDKRENKRTVGTSSPRHKKYTSDGTGVAKQPKMAANIVTSSPFQKIKTVSRIRQNERLIRLETRKQTYHCSQS